MRLKGEPGQKEIAIDYIRSMGVARANEFLIQGIALKTLERLVAEGSLVKPAFGVYVSNESSSDALLSYAVESASLPDSAILCLETAAYLQGLIRRDPDRVYVALPPGTWKPKAITSLCLSCSWWSDVTVDGLTRPAPGIVSEVFVSIAGRPIRMTSPARTVVDLFNYIGRSKSKSGNKMDRELFDESIATEALGTALSEGISISEIESFAESKGIIDRIQPYLRGAASTFDRAR